MSIINFQVGNCYTYSGLAVKDPNTLYFVEDAKKIYKGGIDVTEAVRVVSEFSEIPELPNTVEGKLYILKDTFEVRIVKDGEWVIMSPGYVSTESEFVDLNSNKLATIGATKAYITHAIESITGGTAFVKDLGWDNVEGELVVDKGDVDPIKVKMVGVAKTPTYDKANLKLTIPVIGGSDVVVDFPKDKFVTAGKFYKQYPEPPATPVYTDVIVFTIENQETPVIVPAAALIDQYLADNTGRNVTVTITDDNKISANITVAPSSGNALTYSEAGFMVDVSGKLNTYGIGTSNEIVVSNEAGTTVGRTGKTILSDDGTTELGTSDKAIPVASIIARAIAAAVNASKGEIQDKLDAKVTKVVGTPDSIVAFGIDGAIKDSGMKFGGATISETADANTLATEAAVKDMMSWKPIS